jgi:PPIC-type PPIASE domain
MRRLLREPLLHFFVLGAMLFGLYTWLHGGVAKAPDEIVLTRAQQQSLALQFQRTRLRAPTPQEQQALIDNWVREEVWYREGLAIGLDRDDPVVRRRVGQKLEFIADGATPAAPTEADLQAWLDTHPEKYVIEAHFKLRQVHFDPARRGDRLAADIAAARRVLDSGKVVVGDSTLLPDALTDATASDVRRVFGEAFTDALAALAIGSWRGPVRSGFGLHLVRLAGRTPERRATLDEVRSEVERDMLHARATEALAMHYQKLRERYSVRVETADVVAAAP